MSRCNVCRISIPIERDRCEPCARAIQEHGEMLQRMQDGAGQVPRITYYQSQSQGLGAFRLDEELEALMDYPLSRLRPRPLREDWSSISRQSYYQYKDRLNDHIRNFESYEDKMDENGHQFPVHRQLVNSTIEMMLSWSRALRHLRNPGTYGQAITPTALPRHVMSEQTSIQFVDAKGSYSHSIMPDRVNFEAGEIGQRWHLGDIRKKRFINSGDTCLKCTDGDTDHPQSIGCGLYEFFSFYVGPKLLDPSKWCQICMAQNLTTKARYHVREEHNWGTWYDHPQNEHQSLGQYEGWRHPHPQDILNFWPSSVEVMYTCMKERNQLIAERPA